MGTQYSSEQQKLNMDEFNKKMDEFNEKWERIGPSDPRWNTTSPFYMHPVWSDIKFVPKSNNNSG